MTLPYRWDPEGLTRTTLVRRKVPLVGDLIPFEHAVYRVVEVKETEPDVNGYTVHARVREVGVEVSGDPVADARTTKPLAGKPDSVWMVYAHEHYAICAACHEPLPCREKVAEKISKHAGEKFERYSREGVCPACEEVVSQRQKSVTWEDNAVVPGGPPVTFHLRLQCRSQAVEYERRWVALDPGARKSLYTCGEHHLRNHGDGTYSCTNTECPGPRAWHRSWSVCDCPEHNARDCTPPPDARRV